MIGWRDLSPSHVLTRGWEEFKAGGGPPWHVTHNPVAFATGLDVTENEATGGSREWRKRRAPIQAPIISAILEYQIVYSSSRSLKLVTVVELIAKQLPSDLELHPRYSLELRSPAYGPNWQMHK